MHVPCVSDIHVKFGIKFGRICLNSFFLNKPGKTKTKEMIRNGKFLM